MSPLEPAPRKKVPWWIWTVVLVVVLNVLSQIFHWGFTFY